MKGRLTTIASLAGVLVAGSAAALVNTQILQGTDPKPNEVVVETENSVTDATTGTKIESSVLTASQAMYQVGDAGLVTLDTAGDVLTVVSVEPNAGWKVVKVENYGPTSIEVKLQSGTTLVEFKASLQFGVITTSVESKVVGVDDDDDDNATPGTGTTPGSGTVDDDDDSDDQVDDDSDDDSDDSDDDADDDHGDDADDDADDDHSDDDD